MAIQPAKNGVICRHCNTVIALDHSDRVAEEFSVSCPKCGQRAFYHIKDIKPLERN